MSTLLTVLQSGLLVSGNSDVSLVKVITSGDAMTSFTVSGKTELIALRQGRNETNPMLGGQVTTIADYVIADIFIHYPYANTSSTVTTLRTRVDDFKITIASGTFTNPPRPIFVAESWPVAHEKFGHASLTYRFRYAL